MLMIYHIHGSFHCLCHEIYWIIWVFHVMWTMIMHHVCKSSYVSVYYCMLYAVWASNFVKGNILEILYVPQSFIMHQRIIYNHFHACLSKGNCEFKTIWLRGTRVHNGWCHGKNLFIDRVLEKNSISQKEMSYKPGRRH